MIGKIVMQLFTLFSMYEKGESYLKYLQIWTVVMLLEYHWYGVKDNTCTCGLLLCTFKKQWINIELSRPDRLIHMYNYKKTHITAYSLFWVIYHYMTFQKSARKRLVSKRMWLVSCRCNTFQCHTRSRAIPFEAHTLRHNAPRFHSLAVRLPS